MINPVKYLRARQTGYRQALSLRPADRDYYIRIQWLVAILAVLAFTWGIWSIPIMSTNEARRMVIVQEMLASGHWLIPTLNGETYITKPPLFTWLAAFSGWIFNSTDEWVLRLPSVLCALALLWLIFRKVRGYAGHWPALFSVLILTSTPLFIKHARLAEIELLLTLTTAASMIYFFDFIKQHNKKDLYLSWLFLGLATMSKWPISVVFFVPNILLYAWIFKDRTALRGLFSMTGWLIYLAVALPWLVYVFVQLGPEPFNVFIQKDIVGKAAGSRGTDPFFFHIVTFASTLSPWWLVVFLNRSRQWRNNLLLSRDMVYWFLAFLLPLIIMSLVSKKQSKYILPLFPMAAIFLGYWVGGIYQAWLEKRDQFARRTLVGVITGLIILVLALALYQPRYFLYRYQALKPLVTEIETTQPAVPVYSYQKSYPELAYYYQHPVPKIKFSGVQNLLTQGRSFQLVSASEYSQGLVQLGLCRNWHAKPFLKPRDAVDLLLSPALCKQVNH